MKRFRRRPFIVRRGRLVLATVLFGGALFYLHRVVADLELARVWARIADAQALALGGAALCQTGFLLLQALRWRLLVPKLRKIAALRVFGFMAIANMANMLLPLRGGDIARPFLAARKAGVALNRAIAAAVVERALDVLAIAALALLVALGGRLNLVLTVVLVALACLTLASAPLLLAAQARRRPIPAIRARPRSLTWPEKAYRIILDAFADVGDVATISLAVVWTASSFAFALGTYAAVLWALELSLPLSGLLSLFVITQLGAAVPNAPASLGVFHALAVGLLVAYGVSHEAALSAAVLLHAVLVAVPVGFGLAFATWEGGALLREIAAQSQKQPQGRGDG